MEEKLESLTFWMEKRDERVKTMIGGDFNIKAGKEGHHGMEG